MSEGESVDQESLEINEAEENTPQVTSEEPSGGDGNLGEDADREEAKDSIRKEVEEDAREEAIVLEREILEKAELTA